VEKTADSRSGADDRTPCGINKTVKGGCPRILPTEGEKKKEARRSVVTRRNKFVIVSETGGEVLCTEQGSLVKIGLGNRNNTRKIGGEKKKEVRLKRNRKTQS